MSPLVYIVTFGWIPLTVGLFVALPPRRAVIASYLGAALFLPVAAFKVSGIPDFGKVTAASMVVLPCVVIFDSARLARFRFSMLDLPMLAFGVAPFAASMFNGLGLYDAAANVTRQIVIWVVPYFLGRLYLTDTAAHRDMVVGFLIGTMMYVPLCLLEVRISPQLHNALYGFHQHQFTQTIRAGGYRAMVFMEHPLAVGLWVSLASIMAIWVWWTGAVRRVLGVPLELVIPVFLVALVFCRSLGALVIFTIGVSVLAAAKLFKLRLAILVLAVIPLIYISDRVVSIGLAGKMIEGAMRINPDRGHSLRVRIENEDELVDRALQQPLVGWGGYGRWRIHDDDGNDVSVTDGLWVIVLGSTGLVGLGGLLGWQLLPPLAVLRRIRPRAIASPEVAAPVALSVSLLLIAIDALPNAPNTPVYTMISGGLVGLAVTARARDRAAVRSRAHEAAGAPVLQ